MANQNYMHTAEIMKASLPYFDDRTRCKVELVSKMFDLMGSLSVIGRGSMVACGYEAVSIDVEGLLNGIRPICDHREREMVDRILNIFNAKRMFEMYNNFMNMMNTMQGFGGFPFGEEENKHDTDTVTGNFSDSNYDSIFRDSEQGTEYTMEEEPQDAKKETGSAESKNSGFGNDAMFDMLKTMVPPEQQSTFDNLRMLFGTMSYDNNSKPDDHKEQKDG